MIKTRYAIGAILLAIVVAAVAGAQVPGTAVPSAMSLQLQAEQGAAAGSAQQVQTDQYQFMRDTGGGTAAATDLGRETIDQGQAGRDQLGVQNTQTQIQAAQPPTK